MYNIKTYVKRPQFVRAIQFHKKDFDQYNSLIGAVIYKQDDGSFFLQKKPFNFVTISDGDYILLDENNKVIDYMIRTYFEAWYIEVSEQDKEIK